MLSLLRHFQAVTINVKNVVWF